MNEFYRKWLYRNAPMHVFGNEVFFGTPLDESYNESILKSNIAHHLAEYAIKNCLNVKKDKGCNSFCYHGLMYAFSPDELANLLEKLANETAQTFNRCFNAVPIPVEELPIENKPVSDSDKLNIENKIHASILNFIFEEGFVSLNASERLADKFINLLQDGKIRHISINYGEKK